MRIIAGISGATVAAGVGVIVDAHGQLGTAVHGQHVLSPGTVFTVIENTAATPIAGAFTNLPDGSLITVNSNAFQASYEGGDGNDLTLTVVP